MHHCECGRAEDHNTQQDRKKDHRNLFAAFAGAVVRLVFLLKTAVLFDLKYLCAVIDPLTAVLIDRKFGFFLSQLVR